MLRLSGAGLFPSALTCPGPTVYPAIAVVAGAGPKTLPVTVPGVRTVTATAE